MKQQETFSDTGPLIRVVATAAVIGAILVTVIVIVFLRSGPPPPPSVAGETTILEAMSDAATELTAAPRRAEPVAPLPQPVWIWSTTDALPEQDAYFRRVIEFDDPPASVTMRASCDNRATILLNGEEVGQLGDWWSLSELDLSLHVSGGAATIEIHAGNEGGPAGLIAVIDVKYKDGRRRRIVTDEDWIVSDTPAFEATRAAVVIGPYGAEPWGELAGLIADDIDRAIESLEGFEVELVYKVPRQSGSWVSLAVDGKGRLIASDQTAGLFRITPMEVGEDAAATVVEPIDVPVGAAQGLLCIENDLYCVVARNNRADGPGLYRVTDTDGDDTYDEWKRLRELSTGGEHGPHAVILGPDGMLYIVAGNHTKLPTMEQSVVPRHWGEDHLLPRLWDARGHAVGIMAPGGWIARTDRDGASWELFSIGYRNPYDIAFNRDGELFTYDADMEWDLGAPWYRPTRINYVVSGSEFGWRSGTGKWPSYYPDSLPAILDIGPGSPTGVCFGYDAAFPARYRQAMYALDWTFGTIYAVHLQAEGAGYRATHEPFITGRPLPVADIVANPVDGAMYFVVGGRGVPSAIYRVRWTGALGDESIASSNSPSQPADDARALRRQLEMFHAPGAPESAIDEIWPHLGSDDRFIAFAARIALEHQPTSRWIDRAHAEKDSRAKLQALLAAIRRPDAVDHATVMASLRAINADQLSRADLLAYLRCWSLCFTRLGEPDARTASELAKMLANTYPTDDDYLNRELCDLLVYLDSPVVVARTIPLMERMDTAPPLAESVLLARNDTYGSVIQKMAAAHPQQQQVYYALSLRNATQGWTDDLRRRYFEWFESARLTSGGASFAGFLEQIRRDALEQTPEPMRDRYARIGEEADALPEDTPRPEGPGRQWTVDELLSMTADQLQHRNFENGRNMYVAAQCNLCHRFAGAGQMGGPDLTAVSTRYTLRDLLESIIEPSRVISDQYQQTEFVLDDGSIRIGRVVGRDDAAVRVISNLLMPDSTMDVPAARIVEERPSSLSQMMPGLINRMNADEVLDLLAYLQSEGDERHPLFTSPGS